MNFLFGEKPLGNRHQQQKEKEKAKKTKKKDLKTILFDKSGHPALDSYSCMDSHTKKPSIKQINYLIRPEKKPHQISLQYELKFILFSSKFSHIETIQTRKKKGK